MRNEPVPRAPLPESAIDEAAALPARHGSLRLKEALTPSQGRGAITFSAGTRCRADGSAAASLHVGRRAGTGDDRQVTACSPGLVIDGSGGKPPWTGGKPAPL
jgi:hypothetical protein